VTGDDMLLALL